MAFFVFRFSFFEGLGHRSMEHGAWWGMGHVVYLIFNNLNPKFGVRSLKAGAGARGRRGAGAGAVGRELSRRKPQAAGSG
jgi:hypothetical protein